MEGEVDEIIEALRLADRAKKMKNSIETPA